MWPSFSLCAWRILKIRSCLRSPLAPGKSKVLAILVSSVMFFSFNSAMVMYHLNPRSPKLVRLSAVVSVRGRFSKRRVTQGRQHQAGRRGCFMQPAVVPQQSSLVPTKLLVAPSLQSVTKRRSSFPGFWYWADGTFAWPWRQADKAYTGFVASVKHQINDQSDCGYFSFFRNVAVAFGLNGPWQVTKFQHLT